jgi:kynurenine formamidase
VLLDFYSFSGKSYDPFTSRSITAKELKECAKAQNVTFKYGDILIVRTGWSEAYRKLDEAGRQEMGSKGWTELSFAGVDRDNEMLEFLHDNYFCAVGGDAPSFESWPFSGVVDLHYYLLPRWGVPIGELWDVDGLAELCKKHNRYEFFFTSSPTNVQGKSLPHSSIKSDRFVGLTLFSRLGGVGCSPNAIAIF